MLQNQAVRSKSITTASKHHRNTGFIEINKDGLIFYFYPFFQFILATQHNIMS